MGTAHRYARERGVARGLYAAVRLLAVVMMRSWFRLRVAGAEQLPASGPAIVAANHKSFHWAIVQHIALGWLITMPASALAGAAAVSAWRWL